MSMGLDLNLPLYSQFLKNVSKDGKLQLAQRSRQKPQGLQQTTGRKDMEEEGKKEADPGIKPKAPH